MLDVKKEDERRERERTFIPGLLRDFLFEKRVQVHQLQYDNSGSNVLCFLFPLAVATEFSLKLAPACTCPFRHSNFRPPRSVWGRVMWLACPVNHNSDRTCPRAVARWRKNAAAPQGPSFLPTPHPNEFSSVRPGSLLSQALPESRRPRYRTGLRVQTALSLGMRGTSRDARVDFRSGTHAPQAGRLVVIAERVRVEIPGPSRRHDRRFTTLTPAPPFVRRRRDVSPGARARCRRPTVSGADVVALPVRLRRMQPRRRRQPQLLLLVVPAGPRSIGIFTAPHAHPCVPRVVLHPRASTSPCTTATGRILRIDAGPRLLVGTACRAPGPQPRELVFDPFEGAGVARGGVICGIAGRMQEGDVRLPVRRVETLALCPVAGVEDPACGGEEEGEDQEEEEPA